MATYQGYLSPDLYVHTPTRSASFGLGTVPTPTAWKGILRDRAESGTLTNNQPVSAVPALTVGGVRACSFVDDFYNNVYVYPANLDFGPITEDVPRTIQVWNAYLTSTTVDSIIPASSADDITISGDSLPGTLLALQVGTYTFTAAQAGPSQVNVEYTFTFSDGSTVVMVVKGRRAQAWPFAVNWKRPFKVNYQFETEILTSHSGKEQRRSVLQEPRKSLEFSLVIRDSLHFENFRRLMMKTHTDLWILPEVTRRATLSSGIAEGGQSFTLATVPTWVQVNAIVVLQQSGQSELHTIDTVVGNTITIKSPVVNDWATGAILSPGLSCHIQAQVNTRVHTDSVGEVTLQADVLPGSEPIPFVGTAGLTLKGREVFLKKPNWARGIQRSDQHTYETVDFGAGRVAHYAPVDFATIVQQMDYVNKDSTQAGELIDFFHRMRGRRGEFYMSNRDRDMTLVEPITLGATVLRMKDQELFTYYNEEPTRAAILIQLKNQTVLAHTVTGMVQVNDGNGSDTLVTLGEPVDQVVALDDVDRISWLMVWRLGSDSLTMEWLTDQVAQTRLSMQSLEDLAEE